jgi:hypothetical protein
MKEIRIAVILIITLVVITFIFSGEPVGLSEVIDFDYGDNLNMYHVGALSVCIITVWGLCRLMRRSEGDEEDD